MFKKFPSDEINYTKSAPFFLSRLSFYHSSTVNLRFLKFTILLKFTRSLV